MLRTLADAIIPNAKPTKIPGISAGYGVYRLAISGKSRNGGGAEPFKWMGGAAAAILLAGSLITILNGIAGG